MLELRIPGTELYDEAKGIFITTPESKIVLEHSLVSISKWEARWHKAFLGPDEKTHAEVNDYIKCMTVNKVDDMSYSLLTKSHYEQINKYISDSMTATVFSKSSTKGGSEVMTSELIYYYMIANSIPMDCEKWHINRLLTLIRVCGIKSQPDKKMSINDTMRNNAALNAARRKQMNTRG